MVTDIGIRIITTADALGMSIREVSLAAGLNQDTLGKLLSGKTKSLRGDNLVKVAKVLGVTPEWLASGVDKHNPPANESDFFGEPYGGIVEAGPFRPVDLLNQEDDRRIPVTRDSRYPRGQFAAYEVKGDSMNLENIFEGMWVVAMDAEDWKTWYGDLRDGMLVVVRRTRNDGQEMELTVKQLQIFPDRMVLAPKSSNSRHQPITYVTQSDPDNGENVQIIGVVTKFERPLGRP